MSRYLVALIFAALILTAAAAVARSPIQRGLVGGLDPATVVQKNRILADGGTIINLTLMDAAIKHAKKNGYYSRLYSYCSPEFAVKKDGTNHISKLYDIGPTGNHLVQLTGSAQYLWVANAQNGRAGMQGDGVNTFFNFTVAPLAAGAPSMALVVALKTDVNTAVSHVLFYQGTTTNLQYQAYMPALYNNTAYFGNTNNDRETAAATVANGTNYILEWCYDGALAFSSSQPYFYRNGASLPSTQGTGTGTPNITQGVYRAGEGSQFPNPYKGYIYAFVLMSSRSAALTTFLNSAPAFAIY